MVSYTVVKKFAHYPKIDALNLATASTRIEIITKPTLQCLTNSVSTVVEQLTNDPKFVALNQAAAGTRRENRA
jgi:hypothetical protein